MILLSVSAEKEAGPYLRALAAAGLDDVRLLSPDMGWTEGSIGEQVAAASGLVLSGGVDVEPHRYGEAARPDAGLERRDALEWSLLDAARAARLPVWAICRGVQVVNVYLGGSLWQDLPTERPTAVEHSFSEPADALVHPVEVLAPETALGRRLSHGTVVVNSRHHQAVKRVADGWVAVAASPDGVIEACEAPGTENGDGWWLRGVQWHPEDLIAMAEQRALWDDFARATRSTVEGARP